MPIFADDFLDLMPNSVTVQTFLGVTDDGQRMFSSPITYRARVNTKTHNVIGAGNQLVVARGTAWLDTVDPISVNDKIILDDGTVPIVLAVNVEPDENGPAYTRLDYQ